MAPIDVGDIESLDDIEELLGNIEVTENDVAERTKSELSDFLEINRRMNKHLLFVVCKVPDYIEEGYFHITTNAACFFITNCILLDVCRKERAVRDLVVKGKYPEAGAILRVMLEHVTVLSYIAHNPDDVNDWFVYDHHRRSLIKDEVGDSEYTSDNNFGNLEDLLRKINEKTLYGDYRSLSQFVHTSRQTLAANLRLDEGEVVEESFMAPLQFGPQFNEYNAVLMLQRSYLFMSKGLRELIRQFKFEGGIPEELMEQNDFLISAWNRYSDLTEQYEQIPTMEKVENIDEEYFDFIRD